MDIATTNVDRLTSIVNDILDLEKISSGRSRSTLKMSIWAG